MVDRDQIFKKLEVLNCRWDALALQGGPKPCAIS